MLNQLKVANPFRLVWNRLFSMDVHYNFNVITFGPINPGRPTIPTRPISPCMYNIKSINKHKNVQCTLYIYMPTEKRNNSESISVGKESTAARILNVNNLMLVYSQ